MVINAAWIRFLSSSNVFGGGGAKTRSLMCPQRMKSQGVKSGDLGGPKEQSEVILTNTPNPAMRKSIVEVSMNVNIPMRGCPVLFEDRTPGIISQLPKQSQLQHIQTTYTVFSQEKTAHSALCHFGRY
ncbi:hypothetical protein AVEN_192023-1 [Araneus ventricosus]|uniref:Uncharacterized protein n=1 Tax=Araneus ventricosus TaxID=182803 RepID=A0A4Y2B6L0_ARAVE|nr:hypothetical protein AVEN_192023-1 [Araneus ventricosus]